MDAQIFGVACDVAVRAVSDGCSDSEEEEACLPRYMPASMTHEDGQGETQAECPGGPLGRNHSPLLEGLLLLCDTSLLS